MKFYKFLNNHRRMGSLNLTQVSLKNVQDVFKKHSNEESKGIKVHFRLDESGVLKLDKVCFCFCFRLLILQTTNH